MGAVNVSMVTASSRNERRRVNFRIGGRSVVLLNYIANKTCFSKKIDPQSPNSSLFWHRSVETNELAADVRVSHQLPQKTQTHLFRVHLS